MLRNSSLPSIILSVLLLHTRSDLVREHEVGGLNALVGPLCSVLVFPSDDPSLVDHNFSQ